LFGIIGQIFSMGRETAEKLDAIVVDSLLVYC